jgi:Putative peptidoglycan binding domain
MKSILYSVCIGTLALALTAGGAQAATDRNKQQERAKPQQRTANVQAARPATNGAMRTARSYNSTPQSRQRAYTAPRTGSNFVANRNARLQSMRERNFARNQAFHERTNAAFNRNRNVAANRDRNVATNRTRNAEVRARNDAAVNRERNLAMNRTRNIDVNRQRDANEFRNRNNVAINRNRNVGVSRTQNAAFYRGNNARVTNNWRGDAFRGQRYTVFRNYNRQWHPRSWWTSHYSRIVFVNNGWWYWNAGYWFPAWGYAPYVTFAFDGPIYGYNGLSPDQVTVNVQQQLASAGYYDGPIDGVLGSMTREAIAAYQADNGLAVTSAIDEPTLATMGLV